MRYTLLGFLLLGAFSNRAQFGNPNLQSMVDAERAFIAMAKEQNTRDAFLFFLSDDAVTAGPEGPRTGKETIRTQPVSEGWLHWEVAYCDIAASGDMGYNTGPWEFRAQKTDDKPVAYGEFHSIWKKQADGSWKNILDIGVRHGAPMERQSLTTSQMPLTVSKHSSVSILDLDKKFITAYEKKGDAAYNTFASKEIRFAREGELPIVSKENWGAYLKKSSFKMSDVKVMGGGVAGSNDLGYAYGSGDVGVVVEGKEVVRKGTYLRVWKKEDDKVWRIVLDVVACH
ncbi:nuclear transport factor 2 family protein [Chryseolinea soli]|uniref:Nuclear transport factor 2 family protein n=1 Tax=Chryseolinea soli TaxID=2321403 RepID=A0A385SID7_9BACT|nr:nuclear transport factor 2 family protein [Chryseolinea soli]AYB30221.1 nuclear transport factor 2 family protein [Chryseolinea soli]